MFDQLQNYLIYIYLYKLSLIICCFIDIIQQL